MTAAIEQNNDADGFWLLLQIAPFDVVITPTRKDAAIMGRQRRLRKSWKAPDLVFCLELIAMSALE